MAFNLNNVWKVAQPSSASQTCHAASFRRRTGLAVSRGPTSSRSRAGCSVNSRRGSTGLVVSALKEAFDRDAQRLEAERVALDEQRRRAEEALRLELVRQAADRALARLRAIGALALAIWIVSVLFAMRLPEGFAGAGRVVLACGWASLLAAMAAAFTAHGHVSRWAATAQTSRTAAADLPKAVRRLRLPGSR